MISYKQLIQIVSESLNLRVDNPGGEWLANKQRYAEEDMRKSRGGMGSKGISGSVTAYIQHHKTIELPTEKLKNIPGAMDEHHFRNDVTTDKNQRLEKEIGHPSNFNSKKNPIFIAVNHKGDPYVMEGNHRLAYAVRHKIPKVHTELRYFNGGEDAEHGPLHPSKIGL